MISLTYLLTVFFARNNIFSPVKGQQQWAFVGVTLCKLLTTVTHFQLQLSCI